jgi:four helix bundle protein
LFGFTTTGCEESGFFRAPSNNGAVSNVSTVSIVSIV